MSSGRFLGEKVWQPHSCMMHKYKNRYANPSVVLLLGKKINCCLLLKLQSHPCNRFCLCIKIQINAGSSTGACHEELPGSSETAFFVALWNRKAYFIIPVIILAEELTFIYRQIMLNS